MNHVTVTKATMAPAVNTLAVPRTHAAMVGTAQSATVHSLVPVNLVTTVTAVNTLANPVTMVTIAAKNVSAQSVGVAIAPLVTATADRAIMGSTANNSAVLGILATTAPRDVSARMVESVTL